MAEAVKIPVEARNPEKNKGTGSRFSRKLRGNGRIPAVIYGHKEPVKPISLSRDAIVDFIKKGSHLAELDLGSSTETVLVKAVQWDYLGREIIHVDFARVRADEAIHAQTRLEVRNTAPGVAEGGVLELLVHSIDVKCRANAIPDSIKVDVANLHLNGAIYAKELTLPEGVTLNVDPDTLIVHVTSRAAAEATPVEGEAVTQPEVIKPERKEKEA